MKSKKEKMNLESLAQMIGRGFSAVDQRFDKMDQRFDKMEPDINEMKTDITVMKSDIFDVKEQLGRIEADIVLIKKQLDNVVYRHEFESLKNKISEIEKQLHKIKSA